MTTITKSDREHALDYLDRLKTAPTSGALTILQDAFADRAAEERARIVAWIIRYGDNLNRLIAEAKDGPIKTSTMGEFSACVAICQWIERGVEPVPPEPV